MEPCITTDLTFSADYHTLLKVKIGLPVTHESVSNEAVVWKNTVLRLNDVPWIVAAKEIDAHARAIKNM